MRNEDGKWWCVDYWTVDGVRDVESFRTRAERRRWLDAATEDIIRVYETRYDA